MMNVLLITADQWRGECLSSLGHDSVDTPNLDQLALDGTCFTKHYAQATPCAPSRTSLHTGTYMFNHRCVSNGTPVSAQLTNWAQETRKAGYDPSLFGYTDTAADPTFLSPADPRLRHYGEPLPGIGFHTPMRDEVAEPWVAYLRARGYDIPKRWWNLYSQRVEGKTWCEGGTSVLPLKIAAEDHEPHFMVDACADWIGVQQQPWITHLSLLRPHPPFVAPDPYHALYPPEESFRPLGFEKGVSEKTLHPFLDYMINRSRYGCPDDHRLLQERRSQYFGLMKEVDDNLGRLFQFLKNSGCWDDTLIIFTSDHGEQMGDHGLMSKLGFYDQSYHVPLIVRDPSKDADKMRGQRVELFTENVDLMPTMLDWLGLPTPSQCDGRSLLPLLRDPQKIKDWRSEVYWEYDFRDVLNQGPERALGIPSHQCGLSVVRDHDYKYVHFAALPSMLFDLREDPDEMVDISDDPAHQTVVARYAQKLLSHRMKHATRGFTEIMLSENGPITVPRAAASA